MPTQERPHDAERRPKWLSVKETARQLGDVSTKLIDKLFRQRELEGAKIGGSICILASSVAAYLQAHSNKKALPESSKGLLATSQSSEGLVVTSRQPTRRRRRRSSRPEGFVHLRPQPSRPGTRPTVGGGSRYLPASANSVA
jgi:hypothetical protein